MKFSKALLTLLFLLATLAGKAMAQDNSATSWYNNANGNKKHTITTAAQLADFADRVNGAGDYSAYTFAGDTILLGNTIDLTDWLGNNTTPGQGYDEGKGWKPIGEFTPPLGSSFCGTFDGQGYSITGLWINRPGEGNVGLFGSSYGQIKNLSVEITGDGVIGSIFTGGLVAQNSGTIINCYATGNVTSEGTNAIFTGGLVGLNSSSNNTISNCYATGEVTGEGTNGGLVGGNSGTITNCYATGTVTGKGTNGGLVGDNSGTITNCYATGAVSGTGTNGGLVGNNNGTITNCFFDTGTTGQTVGIGSGTTSGVTDKSTENMQKQATFSNILDPWDFSYTWAIDTSEPADARINSGYPYLQMRDITWHNTSTNVFTLTTAAQLAGLAQLVNEGNDFFTGKTINLGATIDLTDWLTRSGGTKGWMPIGTSAPFLGTFDGQGHSITGLWINRPREDYVGLFGGSMGQIKNLTVEITEKGVTGRFMTGGLVGKNDTNTNTITNCSTTGPVTGSVYVGGLVGDNNGTITNCYATGTVTNTGTGTAYTGGLVGFNSSNSTISNCYATGTVTNTGTGTAYTGGLAGYNNTGANITNCYATGAVLGNGTKGGLVGNNEGTICPITACYFLKYSGFNADLNGIGNEEDNTGATPLNNTYNTDPAKGMKNKANFAAAWNFTTVWAIDATKDNPFNGGYPYLRWQRPTVTLTVTGGETPDNFTYAAGGVSEVKADQNMFAVASGTTFSFTLTPKEGYTVAEAVVTATGPTRNSTTPTGQAGLYTLTAVACDSTITVAGIVLIPEEPADPDPVITYHTLTLTTGEGIVTDKDKLSFQIQSGNPFSFVVTLAEGYAEQTPTVLVNGKTKGLISIGTDKWRCILSEVYEDTRVEVGFHITANEQPDAARIYSRSGQLMIETPTAGTLSVYTVGGQTIVARRIPEGLTAIPLAKGLYIVRFDGQTEKVMIRE